MNMKNDLNVSGYMKCQDLDVNQVSVNGLLRVKGFLNAKNIEVNGMLSVKQDVECETIENNGMLKAKGNMKAQKVECNGYIVTNDLETEFCNINGKIKCNVLNCDSFSLTIEGKSQIKDIEAANIEVYNKRKLNRYLNVKSLSADTISIENVKCDIVTGDTVIIGQNCVIKKVEYKTSIEIHPSAKVIKQEKV